MNLIDTRATGCWTPELRFWTECFIFHVSIRLSDIWINCNWINEGLLYSVILISQKKTMDGGDDYSEGFHIPTIVSLPSLPWPTSNPKYLSPAKVITTRLCVSTWLGNWRCSGEVWKLRGDVEGVNPCDFFPWHQYNQWNQSRSLYYCSVWHYFCGKMMDVVCI
jgi:hypothetical protein